MALGVDEGKIVALIVSDGDAIEILPTALGASSGVSQELFQTRIDALGDNAEDALDVIDAMTYNMPYTVGLSDEYDTLDEARAAAQAVIDTADNEGVVS